MARRQILSQSERESLLALPDDELALTRMAYFSEHDLVLISAHRKPASRFGFAVLLCYLKNVGFAPDKKSSPPAALLRIIGARLKLSAELWQEYISGRDTTRREHLGELYRYARGQGADFQEYMIAPCGAPTFREAVRWGSEVYQALRHVLLEKGLSTGVGDEGGFAPAVSSNREPLELIVLAIEKAGYRPGEDIVICMDPASSEFYRDGKYHLHTENTELTSQEMTNYYQTLVKNFPIALIEDGLAEDDWTGWKILHDTLGEQVELVGDDLFVTNVKYIQRGIDENLANAALIKLNQIGSLSETFDAVQLCHDNNWGAFISHRSGETVDSFIADMTVAMRAGHLKTGAPCRGERIEKYNQLMRIEDELGSSAQFAGKSVFK